MILHCFLIMGIKTWLHIIQDKTISTVLLASVQWVCDMAVLGLYLQMYIHLGHCNLHGCYREGDLLCGKAFSPAQAHWQVLLSVFPQSPALECSCNAPCGLQTLGDLLQAVCTASAHHPRPVNTDYRLTLYEAAQDVLRL